MLSSASYKKVRTISEGNFHSCYASNKAEKFKFRRLSQGLESCAQAQALKLRKEEKELIKVFQNLQHEKEKHLKERKDQKYYLEHADDASSGMSSANSTISGNRSSDGSLTKGIDKKERRASMPAKFDSTFEVVPFYMRHSYTHYHDDPHYDHIAETTKGSDHNVLQSEDEEPCWKKNTKLARLKTRRQAITTIPEEQLFFLRMLPNNNSTENDDYLPPSGGELSKKSLMKIPEKSSSNFGGGGGVGSGIKQQSSLMLPDIATGSMDNHLNSVLTPLERQELAKHHHHHHRGVLTPPPIMETERRSAVVEQGRMRPRRHTIHCVNNSKTSFLKSLLIRRWQNGETISDIAKDEAFDNILDLFDDGRIHPAYDPAMDLTFDDFCALRKCKYLRLSQLNLQSLKEATLSSLVGN